MAVVILIMRMSKVLVTIALTPTESVVVRHRQFDNPNRASG